MKVIHLTTVDLSLRFLVFPQLRAVMDAGGQAIGVSSPGPWVEGLKADGIRHIALSSSTRGFDLLADLRAAVDLYRVLRRERPDVLHTHNPKPGVYGRIVGRLARVPIVVNTVHGLYATEDDSLLKRAVVYGIEGIASRFSDAELVQNPEDLELLARLRLAPRGHLVLLGNGVDLQRFDATRSFDAERDRVRAELGVRSDEIVVGAVGRLVVGKGYRELFDAFERLGHPFRLVVVGAADPEKADGLSERELQAARDAGALLLGHRDDVDAIYGAMDVFVLPSHREGFPRVAMEAAAMGLPLVCTDIRGCRQVVDDGVNGVLVPVEDAEALAAAIGRLGSDAELRRNMGESGKRIARERFDERGVVERVMQTYEEVARRKGVSLT